MKKIITDTSVMVKWISDQNESYVEVADQILSDVQAGKIVILAPELSKYELGNAILKKGLTLFELLQSLNTVYSLPVQFVPETEDLAEETYKIVYEIKAKNIPITYYDAAFAALARHEEAELVTANPKHQSGIKGVKTISLSEYR